MTQTEIATVGLYSTQIGQQHSQGQTRHKVNFAHIGQHLTAMLIHCFGQFMFDCRDTSRIKASRQINDEDIIYEIGFHAGIPLSSG
jgi:pyruvate/2-oxoglutarate dehydrogenase complex dihydrolipoamide dehydrogenase (E3) component